MKLQSKLILFICSLLLTIILVIGLYIEHLQTESIQQQIGMRALTVAETVSRIPEIRTAFFAQDPSQIIQPLVEDIRIETGAEYIVVGNREGVRYSHPLPERIGEHMIGGDNAPVLRGESIISEAVGSLGPSLRGKAPIYDERGKVIGIVSVGFLQEDIEHRLEPGRQKLAWVILLGLLAAVIGAVLIANSVKRAIFGLEPAEIARLYREQEAVLESVREGIFAVNRQGFVTMANHAAKQMLGLSPEQDLKGSYSRDVQKGWRLLKVMESGVAEYDREMIVGDEVVMVNRIPVKSGKGDVIGAVASFRSKSDWYKVNEELSQVKRYAESLRAQTHEFSNKLYMISGLIQLESYQEAMEIISRESDVHQHLVHFIMRYVPDPMIGGLLIGKFNRANELKVELYIDKESTFVDLPPGLDRNHLVTILGNLIDNAMEAVLQQDGEKQVHVFLTDLGADLILEVEDTGPGIPEGDVERIFEVGYSTKGAEEHRGFGLALVKKAVEQLGGYLTITANQPTGSVFTVAIPKHAPGGESTHAEHLDRGR
ncbi:two-component system CitB family sensor kinase [Tumebacillus sp. BK434]|uniref:ATP-binding protein n=1 Tax=Tumebacillus sp. BK434 TaxID=2512169 RepID=UPI00105067C7|nr:sensor histidine kinase [Tumebacillus sp. BK434]TCP52170.1 two-component system CitB family sensor kinase [Tumebacillus sp. BK434]